MRELDEYFSRETILLAQGYLDAVSSFADSNEEIFLEQAHCLARKALETGLAVADISVLHHICLRKALDTSMLSATHLHRLEQFYLEIISVYDMALCGYKNSVEGLRIENKKRKKIEKKLCELTSNLRDQRDSLDVKVKIRTDELATKAKALELTNTQLQNINREQAEFTYAISHDLKSPTNTISMLVNELSETCGDELSADGRELIDLSLETINRMGALVDDVLGYSRSIETGFSMEMVNIDVLLPEILADLSGDIAMHNVQIEVLPIPPVMGNALQLRILFQNLISNAIKFRKKNRPTTITVYSTFNSEDGRQKISVRDNGIGIDPSFHERIFALFQRLHTHENYPGSGLGLTLCKRIALNHSGAIVLESAPGLGSTFSLDIYGGLDGA